MATYKAKQEIVDGRTFEGGRQNGTNLAHWVLSHGGQAHWAGPVEPYPEKVYIITPMMEYIPAYVGDTIVLRQNGRFEVERPETLKEKYDQV